MTAKFSKSVESFSEGISYIVLKGGGVQLFTSKDNLSMKKGAAKHVLTTHRAASTNCSCVFRNTQILLKSPNRQSSGSTRTLTYIISSDNNLQHHKYNNEPNSFNWPSCWRSQAGKSLIPVSKQSLLCSPGGTHSRKPGSSFEIP